MNQSECLSPCRNTSIRFKMEVFPVHWMLNAALLFVQVGRRYEASQNDLLLNSSCVHSLTLFAIINLMSCQKRQNIFIFVISKLFAAYKIYVTLTGSVIEWQHKCYEEKYVASYYHSFLFNLILQRMMSEKWGSYCAQMFRYYQSF